MNRGMRCYRWVYQATVAGIGISAALLLAALATDLVSGRASHALAPEALRSLTSAAKASPLAQTGILSLLLTPIAAVTAALAASVAERHWRTVAAALAVLGILLVGGLAKW